MIVFSVLVAIALVLGLALPFMVTSE